MLNQIQTLDVIGVKGAKNLASQELSASTEAEGTSAPPEFNALLLQSKSEQQSPLSMKKLAAAVSEESEHSIDQVQPIGIDKKQLSELTGEQLVQFLMAQSTLSDESSETPVPEHLSSWIDSELAVDDDAVLLSYANVDLISLTNQPPSGLEEDQNADLAALTSDALEEDGMEVTVTPELNDEAAIVTNGDLDLAIDQSTSIDSESTLSQPESSAGLFELAELQGTNKTSSAVDELEPAEAEKLISAKNSMESSLASAELLVQEELEEVGSVEEPLNTSDDTTQEQLLTGNITTALDDSGELGTLSSEVKAKIENGVDLTRPASEVSLRNKSLRLESNGELKPISILADASEQNDGEPAKLANLGEAGLKANAPIQDLTTEKTKLGDQLVNSVPMAEKEPEATNSSSTISTASLNLPEVNKASRLVQESAINMQALQKSMKLPDASPALNERIHSMIKNNIQHGFIRLDPPELGALEVRIQVTQESTQVQITSPSHQVREALESQSIRLREALSEQGLNLGRLDVNDNSSGDSSSRSGGEQLANGSGNEVDTDSQDIDAGATVTTLNGLVDQYV